MSDARADDDVVVDIRGIRRRRGSGADAFTLNVPSFRVRRGECVALTGPSGCGKSTMLDLLGLVLRPDAAEVFVLTDPTEGRTDVGALWRSGAGDALARLRATRIGYVLQTGGLLPFLAAGDNVRLSPWLLGAENDRHDALIERLVGALGLGALLAKMPRALSIGERQRVAIARALAHRPTLLLADEPTAALDPGHAIQVMGLLLQLVREFHITAVIVTHDWEMVRSMGLREVRATMASSASGSSSRFTG